MAYRPVHDEDTGEVEDYCDVCDRDFVDYSALIQHLENSSQHFYCQLCSRDFVSYDSRQQHYKTSARHAGTYCNRCDLNFVSASLMLEHKRATPFQHFMCEPCNLDYGSSEDLRQHFIHSALHQSTCCRKCAMFFSTPDNLREVRMVFAKITPQSLILG